ncbi:hypothetical protein VC95412_001146B, partial [Vibrio cholerae O1 str. 95412]
SFCRPICDSKFVIFWVILASEL